MKKVLALVLCVALALSMCACSSGEKGGNDDSDANQGSAVVSIDRQVITPVDVEHTDRFDIHYDLVTLDDSKQTQYTAINDTLKSAFDSFAAEAVDVGGIEAFEGDTYLNTVDAEISHNCDNLLSIKYTTNWYMGGVFNANCFGCNFNLATGEQVTLNDLIADENKENALAVIKDSIREYIRDNNITPFDDMEETIQGYTLDNLMFYVLNGNAVVCISTYELAPGSEGHMEINTNVPVSIQ